MEERPKTGKRIKKDTQKEVMFNASDGLSSFKGQKPVGEDPALMIAELSPGKKGGHFEMPFGGLLSVPEGVMQKKDIVTCCQVSPSNRYKYLPPLGLHDHLLSEVFLFSTSCKFHKKMGIKLRLPFHPDNQDICEVIVRIKVVKDDEWRNCDFSFSEVGHFVELSAEGPGIYVVVSTPKVERVQVPVDGVLHNTRLSKQISLRFPKKATDTEMVCNVQILPLNRRNLPALRRDHPHEMEDLVTASDFYDVRPSVPKEFKRSVTVKLPLPPMDENAEYNEEDLCVMALMTDGWVVLETPLKFTKTSVTFDTKVLTRFCVALALAKRKKRLKETFKHIQREANVSRGELLTFIHLEEKSWTLWIECTTTDQVEHVVNKRISQGFRRVEREISKVVEEDYKIVRRQRMPKNKPEEKKQERNDLDLVPGLLYDLEMNGDLQICETDPGKFFMGLQYHQRLQENYRKFAVKPRDYMEEDSDMRSLHNTFKIHAAMPSLDDGTLTRTLLRTIAMDIEPEIVKAYFYEEPIPEPVRQVVIVEPEPEPEPRPVAPPVVKQKTMSMDTFQRLITPTRPPKKISKESKVLTGRSLMTLAREIEQGLTLAIHLDLNDSTITGMGFDALAKGQSLVDITYKILMLWKRKSSRHKDRQIDMLVYALQQMQREDVAAILLDKHRQNVELTPECFDSIHSREP